MKHDDTPPLPPAQLPPRTSAPTIASFAGAPADFPISLRVRLMLSLHLPVLTLVDSHQRLAALGACRLRCGGDSAVVWGADGFVGEACIGLGFRV